MGTVALWVAATGVAIATSCGALVATTTAAASTGPAITVTPDTGLRDGDMVTVAGTGFTPASTVGLLECSDAPATATSQCDLSALVAHAATAGPDGSFSKAIPVKTGVVGSGTCAPGSSTCEIVAAGLNEYPQEGASAGISFAKLPRHPTTTTAAFSNRKHAIVGRVTAHGTGVKDLPTTLEIRHGTSWTSVDHVTTDQDGSFVYRHVTTSGTYEVVTSPHGRHKGSTSKAIKVKV